MASKKSRAKKMKKGCPAGTRYKLKKGKSGKVRCFRKKTAAKRAQKTHGGRISKC